MIYRFFSWNLGKRSLHPHIRWINAFTPAPHSTTFLCESLGIKSPGYESRTPFSRKIHLKQYHTFTLV